MQGQEQQRRNERPSFRHERRKKRCPKVYQRSDSDVCVATEADRCMRMLFNAGRLEKTQDGYAILSDPSCYDPQRGLLLRSDAGLAFMV